MLHGSLKTKQTRRKAPAFWRLAKLSAICRNSAGPSADNNGRQYLYFPHFLSFYTTEYLPLLERASPLAWQRKCFPGTLLLWNAPANLFSVSVVKVNSILKLQPGTIVCGPTIDAPVTSTRKNACSAWAASTLCCRGQAEAGWLFYYIFFQKSLILDSLNALTRGCSVRPAVSWPACNDFTWGRASLKARLFGFAF